LQERYSSQTAYIQKVDEVARALVAERLLLAEDAARYVDEARQQMGEKESGHGIPATR
jgi:hypothetical protein